jgi:uncharacterized protein (DUF58 family)
MAGRKLLPAAVLLLCAVAAAVINTPIAYVPLVFCVLLCLASVLYTLALAYSCVLSGQPGERRRYERDSSACYPVTIRNRGFLAVPWVTLTLQAKSVDGLPPLASQHELMLRPRETLTLELPLTFPHIGQYEVRVSSLRFHGLLGIFSLSRRPSWSVSVQVTPKLFPLPRLKLHTVRPAFAVEFSVPHQMDGGEYADIRQYVPGDPIKNIHWKLSAHSAGYVSRTFRTDAVSGVSIYLDVRFPAHLPAEEMASVNDCLVESAYAVAAHALGRDYRAELIYTQGSVPTALPLQDRELLTEAVCALRPASTAERYPVELLVEEHAGRADALDHIVVLTPTVSKALVELLSVCRQRGKRPVLLHLYGEEQPGAPGAEIIADRGIEYHVISSAGQLAGALEEER